MNDRRGYITPLIHREHRQTILAGWRLAAWVDLCDDADHTTGVVRLSAREMADMWEVGRMTVERWIDQMEEAGYLRTHRLGDTPRAGRYLVIRYIADRQKEPAAEGWDKVRDKTGTNDGTKKDRRRLDNQPVDGTNDGTKAGQSVGHVERKDNPQGNLPTVPTEPAGEPAEARPALVLVIGDGPEPGHDPDRITGGQLLAAWIGRQHANLTDRERQKQGAAAKRVCEGHTRTEINAAWWGITHRYPWARAPGGKGQSWDMMDFEREFVKSVQYAMENHPDLRQARLEAELLSHLDEAAGF